MTNESMETRQDVRAPNWAQALSDLELSLQEATRAVAALRQGLAAIGFNVGPSDAAVQRVGEPRGNPAAQVAATVQGTPASAEKEPPRIGPAVTSAEQVGEGQHGASFDRLWDKIERERSERTAQPEEHVDTRRGLELLPQSYLMTVEDREGRVSLVPLHRGLQGLPGIEEVNLVSYANGVPVISLRSKDRLNLDTLGEVVGRVMDRSCEVIQQDAGKLYLRLKANSREEEV